MFFSSKASGITWLVVFLGNPGPKYAMTRHNVGFMTADELEKSKGTAINKLRFQALTARCELGGGASPPDEASDLYESLW